MNSVEFISVNKYFDTKTVLKDLSFSIAEGEIVAFLGANGTGKSTIFNLMNGIQKPSSGEVLLGVRSTQISYLQQNYRDTLLPWKTNFQNIILPLTIQHIDKIDAEKKIAEQYKILDLNLNLKSYPYQLSGGQQQKLALFRSLITQPKLLCLDEPFSALDFKIRKEISDVILNYWRKEKATICLITHDIDEAMLLASRIIILSNYSETSSLALDRRIKFEYPRNTSLMATLEYNTIKKAILNCLCYE